jgi:hypothetical protein
LGRFAKLILRNGYIALAPISVLVGACDPALNNKVPLPGYLDEIRKGKTIEGWAMPDSSSKPAEVLFYADKPPSEGGAPLGSILANKPRKDLASLDGKEGLAFIFDIPKSFFAKKGPRYIYAYVRDSVTGKLTGLPGGPLTWDKD